MLIANCGYVPRKKLARRGACAPGANRYHPDVPMRTSSAEGKAGHSAAVEHDTEEVKA
jgi:hypothetical protein